MLISLDQGSLLCCMLSVQWLDCGQEVRGPSGGSEEGLERH